MKHVISHNLLTIDNATVIGSRLGWVSAPGVDIKNNATLHLNSEVGGGQFSFEERMGCGFGACMGCSCKTKYGSKRICKDGPVLEKEEIIW